MNVNEYQTISYIVLLLTPIKETAEALCQQDATLIRADIALEFMLTKIKQQQSEIGKQLYAALSHRIKEKRTPLSSIVYYLHNAQVTSSKIPDVFVPNTSAQNKKIVINLIKCINSADIIASADVNSDSDVRQARSVIIRLKLLVKN